jgi:hypothetical protein
MNREENNRNTQSSNQHASSHESNQKSVKDPQARPQDSHSEASKKAPETRGGQGSDNSCKPGEKGGQHSHSPSR